MESVEQLLKRQHWLRLSASLAVLIVLAGCGNGKCGVDGKGVAQQSQQATAPAQQGVASNLHIDEYGPHDTKAGEPFNQQPDGSSAAWFRLNKNLEGGVVNVHLNNVVIKGDISGAVVTVRVPNDLHAAEGHISASVDKVDGATVTPSNTVDIAVSKP